MSGAWREKAACRDVADPDAFFPAAEAGPEYDAQVAAAKAVCADCTVRAACLQEALRHIPYGIAGGLTPEERRGLAARRGVDRDTAALTRGLAPGATRAEVTAAGLVLLTAGRPIGEIAARCGVRPETVHRWRTRHQHQGERATASNGLPARSSTRTTAPTRTPTTRGTEAR